MKRIAFSGTLDPITNGHMWVIQEARALADEVVVLLSENPFKKPQFAAAARKRIVEDSVAERGWDNVSVVLVRGDYTARAAKRLGIDFLIRGIRNTADFDYENLIQQANVDVLHGARTLFVMPPRDLGSVSSSFVRGLQGPVGWHAITRRFMPAPAYRAWILDWLDKQWRRLWQEAHAHWFTRLSSGEGDAERAGRMLDRLVLGLSEAKVWAANADASEADLALLDKAIWFGAAVRGSEPEDCAQLWLGAGLDDADTARQVAILIRSVEPGGHAAGSHRLRDAMLGIHRAILA